MSNITIFLIVAAIVLPVVILVVVYLWRATKFYRDTPPEYRPKRRGLSEALGCIPLVFIAIHDLITGENSFRSPRRPLRKWLIAAVILAVLLAALTLCGGCLSRTEYYAPTDTTTAMGADGKYRGAIKAEGQYPWWSEASGKSFLNPTVSIAP